MSRQATPAPQPPHPRVRAVAPRGIKFPIRDRAKLRDTAFTHRGRSVLLLDASVTKAMVALALDVRITKSGEGLKLRRGPRESE